MQHCSVHLCRNWASCRTAIQYSLVQYSIVQYLHFVKPCASRTQRSFCGPPSTELRRSILPFCYVAWRFNICLWQMASWKKSIFHIFFVHVRNLGSVGQNLGPGGYTPRDKRPIVKLDCFDNGDRRNWICLDLSLDHFIHLWQVHLNNKGLQHL